MLKKLLDAIEQQGKERGLSRTQLAALLGISENYLYRLRNGDREPGLDFLTAVRRAFPGLKPLIWEYEESLSQAQESPTL